MSTVDRFILQKKKKREILPFPAKAVNNSTLGTLSEAVRNVSRLEGPSAAPERLPSLCPVLGLVDCTPGARSLELTPLPGLRRCRCLRAHTPAHPEMTFGFKLQQQAFFTAYLSAPRGGAHYVKSGRSQGCAEDKDANVAGCHQSLAEERCLLQ